MDAERCADFPVTVRRVDPSFSVLHDIPALPVAGAPQETTNVLPSQPEINPTTADAVDPVKWRAGSRAAPSVYP
jgi:hypothetical protein